MSNEDGKKSGLRRLNRAVIENDESDRVFFGKIRGILLRDFVENPDIYTIRGVVFPSKVTFRGEEQPLDWWAPILLFEFGQKLLALTWEDDIIVSFAAKRERGEIIFPGESGVADLKISSLGSTFRRCSPGGEVVETFSYTDLSLLYRNELTAVMERFLLMDEEWYKKFSKDGFEGLGV